MIRRYAARVVLLDAEGSTLLFHWTNREKGTRWWSTPGGGVEAGERSIDAARRELLEECGVEPLSLEGPAWRAEHFFRSGADLYLQIEAFFIARVAGVAPEIELSGLDRFETEAYLGHRWWTVAELAAAEERVFPKDLPQRLLAIERGEPVPDATRPRGGSRRG